MVQCFIEFQEGPAELLKGSFQTKIILLWKSYVVIATFVVLRIDFLSYKQVL